MVEAMSDWVTRAAQSLGAPAPPAPAPAPAVSTSNYATAPSSAPAAAAQPSTGITAEQVIQMLLSGANPFRLLTGQYGLAASGATEMFDPGNALPINTTRGTTLVDRSPGVEVRPTGQMNTVPAQTLLEALYSMNPDTLIRLQRKLYDGNFYDSQKASGQTVRTSPTWGIVDPATMRAYMNAMAVAATNPNKTLDEVIADSERPNFIDRSSSRKARLAEQVAGLKANAQASLTSTAGLNSILDKIGPALIGHGLSAAKRQELIDLVHGKETNVAQTALDAQSKVAQVKAQGVSDDDVNHFLDLVSKGGTLGFDAAGWKQWLDKVGMPADTPMTAENQRQVAHELVLDYYDSFHNWRDVATAFLAGPGAANAQTPPVHHDFGRTVGGAPSIQDAADAIAHGMSQPANAATAGSADLRVQPIEAIDPAAELEQQIKTQNPTEYYGHETATRWEQFMNMLGPSVPGAGVNAGQV